MVEIDKGLLKIIKDMLHTLSQITNGVVLRDRTVSKAGNSSAVIFVPKYLLGQKVKIIIIPEDSELAGIRKTLDKKNKKISKLTAEVNNLNTSLNDIEGSKSEATENAVAEDSPVNKEGLEDDEAY